MNFESTPSHERTCGLTIMTPEQTAWKVLYDSMTDQLRDAAPDTMREIAPFEKAIELDETLAKSIRAKLDASPHDYGFRISVWPSIDWWFDWLVSFGKRLVGAVAWSRILHCRIVVFDLCVGQSLCSERDRNSAGTPWLQAPSLLAL